MIAGAKLGDYIEVELVNNQRVIMTLKEIKTFGIEGIQKNLLHPKLKFIPYTSIISITIA